MKTFLHLFFYIYLFTVWNYAYVQCKKKILLAYICI